MYDLNGGDVTFELDFLDGEFVAGRSVADGGVLGREPDPETVLLFASQLWSTPKGANGNKLEHVGMGVGRAYHQARGLSGRSLPEGRGGAAMIRLVP